MVACLRMAAQGRLENEELGNITMEKASSDSMSAREKVVARKRTSAH